MENMKIIRKSERYSNHSVISVSSVAFIFC